MYTFIIILHQAQKGHAVRECIENWEAAIEAMKAQWNTNTHALELTLGTSGEMLNVYFSDTNKHCNIVL